MRPPRHRFSEDVRATTRSIAADMVQEGSVAQTPDQLADWISHRPDVKQDLERGGYDTAFTALDLFPLLQANVAKAAEAPVAAVRSRPLKPIWIAGLALLLAILLGVLLGVLG